MRTSRRAIKLFAVIALVGPMLFNHLACSSREIAAAASSGIQTTLADIFEVFSEDLADAITGVDE